jgi:hypothetical protein
LQKTQYFQGFYPFHFLFHFFSKNGTQKKSGTSQRRKDRAQQLADVMLEVQQGEME